MTEPTPPTDRSGAALIAEERQRQIASEGYSHGHDDEHTNGSIAAAAAAYALASVDDSWADPSDFWPWDLNEFKPSPDLVKNLVRAGALIAAEIDRLQRAEPTPPTDHHELTVEGVKS